MLVARPDECDEELSTASRLAQSRPNDVQTLRLGQTTDVFFVLSTARYYAAYYPAILHGIRRHLNPLPLYAAR